MTRTGVASRVAGWPWLGRLGALAVIAAAAAVVVSVGRAVAARITFDMPLEWIEGQTLEGVARVFQDGPGLYPDPASATGLADGPLYLAVAAAASLATGVRYTVARAISVLATLATLALAYRAVATHGTDRRLARVLGILAAGAVAAAYVPTSGGFDVVRPTAMGTALLAAAVLALAPGASRRPWPKVAAVLAALAVLAVPGHLVYVPWLAGWAIAASWRPGLRFTLAFLVALAVPVVACEIASDGWFLTWIGLPLDYGIDLARFGATELKLFTFAPHALLTVLAGAFAAGRRLCSRRAVLWWGLLTLSLPVQLTERIVAGGDAGALAPILVFAPVATLCLALDVLAAVPAVAWRQAAASGALALGAFYLAAHRVPAGFLVPSAVERKRAVGLEELVASLPGKVTIPSLPSLGRAHVPSSEQVLGVGYAELFWAGQSDLADMKVQTVALGADWLLLADADHLRDSVGAEYAPWCRVDPGYAPGHLDGAEPAAQRAAALRWLMRDRRSAPLSLAAGQVVEVDVCGAQPAKDLIGCAIGAGFVMPSPRSALLWAGADVSRILARVDDARDAQVVLHVASVAEPGEGVVVRVDDRPRAIEIPEVGADLIVDLPQQPGAHVVSFEPSAARPAWQATPGDEAPRVSIGFDRVSCRAGRERHALHP